jgi:hypothetical protein
VRAVSPLAALLLTAGVASAQTAITVSPSPARLGDPVTVAGMACAAGATPTASFNTSQLPATAGSAADSFRVDTATLKPGSYKVTLRCGDKASGEAALTIIDSPVVTCVENMTPEDGWKEVSKGADAEAISQSPEEFAKNKPQAERGEWTACNADKVRWIVRMESPIRLHVAGYRDWLSAQQARKETTTVHLFLAGIELPNVTAQFQGHDPVTGDDILWAILKFESSTDAMASRDAWAQVLRIARRSKALPISLGHEGGPYWTSRVTVELNSYPTFLKYFAGSMIAGLVLVLLLAGWKTQLLRDRNGAANPPYSLARHQMAVWFLVVISAYLFVMMTTGAAAATSATALTLIGISGATGLTAIALDKSKRTAVDTEQQSLTAERAAVDAALNDPATGLVAQLAAVAPGTPASTQIQADIQAKRQRLVEIDARLGALKAQQPTSSVSWTQDLLSDEDGISFHRLQIAVWTIVLVGTFVTAVWRTFAMPDFDSTTLGLMGISSGMYLGFKFPEKPA